MVLGVIALVDGTDWDSVDGSTANPGEAEALAGSSGLVPSLLGLVADGVRLGCANGLDFGSVLGGMARGAAAAGLENMGVGAVSGSIVAVGETTGVTADSAGFSVTLGAGPVGVGSGAGNSTGAELASAIA